MFLNQFQFFGHTSSTKLLPGRDHTRDLEERVRYEETQFKGILAVPGAVQLVQSLQGHPWAIVTSAWRKLAEARITAAGLPLPEVIVPVDEIRKGKPDPEGFLRAAEQLQVEPEQCLVFEDTRPGIEAGLSAGMTVVGLLTTFPADHLKHNLLIRDFHDVTLASDGDFINVAIHCSTLNRQ